MKPKGEGNALQQAAGDPLAVAKQQQNDEKIRNEVKHLTKNRTTDFIVNP